MSNQDDLEIAINDSEKKDDESTPLEYELQIYPADFTLEVLYHKWKNEEIVIPPFQRGYVWSLVMGSRLIESFLMGLPIPPIFLYIQPDHKNLIIDGRQRLQTIFYFFEGYFGELEKDKRRVFKLDGINEKSKWYKKAFNEFTEADKRNFKNAVLRSIMIKQIKPKDEDTSIYHIFERLNTGGVSLIDQEVRNCIYYGKLNELLIELNKDQNWRMILGKQNVDSRQKDVQLILRCLSLLHESNQYQKPMKEFLSKFMSKHRNPSERFILEQRNLFLQTCSKIIKYLGERPLNPKGALNPSILDAIFIAFAKNINSDQDGQSLKKKFTLLKEDERFKKLVSDATTDPDILHERLEFAEKYLFG